MLEYYCEYDPNKVMNTYLRLDKEDRNMFASNPEITLPLIDYLKTVKKENPELYTKLEKELTKSAETKNPFASPIRFSA